MRVVVAKDHAKTAALIMLANSMDEVVEVRPICDLPNKSRAEILGKPLPLHTLAVSLYNWGSSVALGVYTGPKETLELCAKKLEFLKLTLDRDFTHDKDWQRVTKPAGETATSIIPCTEAVPLVLSIETVEAFALSHWRFTTAVKRKVNLNLNLNPKGVRQIGSRVLDPKGVREIGSRVRVKFNGSFSRWLLDGTGVPAPGLRFEHCGDTQGGFHLFVSATIDSKRPCETGEPLWSELHSRLQSITSDLLCEAKGIPYP